MGVLNELLSIKTFREGKAEILVRKQRQVLAQALEQRDAAQSQLEEFEAFARRREQEMFADLCLRVVVVRDILEVNGMVGEMKAQVLHYQKSLDEAQAHHEAQARTLDEKKQLHQQASRIKEKFIELVRLHAAQVLAELERKEDAELEEVAETRRDRNEDLSAEVPSEEAET